MKSECGWSIVVALACVILVQFCRAENHHIPKDDRIESLPGQPAAVNFKQYGGYITVDEKQTRALFYYFVEAETKPAAKPLVLWLAGGPGCSSVGLGAFSEHGPFRASGGRSLIRNYYSWNREANMLYLESPAGVGFSYSANASFYDLVNDTITAQDNLKFLEQWFLKYPKYKNRDLYIAGSSYAGHFVPQLAQLIVNSRVKFNLKGIAMGNPLLEFYTDIKAEGDYYWTHGLISDATYQRMNSICNNTQLWRERIAGNLSAACNEINATLAEETAASSLDVFHVTFDKCLTPVDGPEPRVYQPKAGENVDVCVEIKASDYMKREAVRKALHGRLVGVSKWEMCSEVMTYDLRNIETPTINVVGSLVRLGIRVLVYSGDQDSRIPFSGSRNLVNGLAKELGLRTTVPYRPWLLDKQVGGWTQVYGDILTFATIRGGGHSTPSSSPKRSFALFSAFLAGKPLPKE